MKVSMELNVSDKEFYDLMMKSLKEEVKNVTKKNLELKEGLKYKKKSAQRKGIGSEITVHIKRLIPNTLYEATFVTAIDHTTISYKIESLNESKIKVTYEEIYENHLLASSCCSCHHWMSDRTKGRSQDQISGHIL